MVQAVPWADIVGRRAGSGKNVSHARREQLSQTTERQGIRSTPRHSAGNGQKKGPEDRGHTGLFGPCALVRRGFDGEDQTQQRGTSPLRMVDFA